MRVLVPVFVFLLFMGIITSLALITKYLYVDYYAHQIKTTCKITYCVVDSPDRCTGSSCAYRYDYTLSYNGTDYTKIQYGRTGTRDVCSYIYPSVVCYYDDRDPIETFSVISGNDSEVGIIIFSLLSVFLIVVFVIYLVHVVTRNPPLPVVNEAGAPLMP